MFNFNPTLEITNLAHVCICYVLNNGIKNLIISDLPAVSSEALHQIALDCYQYISH